MSVWNTLSSLIPGSSTNGTRKVKRAATAEPAQVDPKVAAKRTALVDISNRDATTITAATKRPTRNSAKASKGAAEAPRLEQLQQNGPTNLSSAGHARDTLSASSSSQSLPSVQKSSAGPMELASPDHMLIDDPTTEFSAFVQPAPLPPRDIDLDDVDDPQCCTTYVMDIFNYLREVEVRSRPERFTLDHQREVTPKMRSILVDWLVDVAEEYRLTSETLFLAVNYLDRYLSLANVTRSELQLVGIVCCLIASKYEEIHPPLIEDFIYISDYAYTREKILEMERNVLNTLKFDLSAATIRNFTKRFLKAAEANQKTRFLAYYLNELSLLDITFLKYPSSLIAACSVCLALHTLNLADWSPTFEYYSGYKTTDLAFQSCLRDLYNLYKNADKLQCQSVREKYSHTPLMKVALIPPRIV